MTLLIPTSPPHVANGARTLGSRCNSTGPRRRSLVRRPVTVHLTGASPPPAVVADADAAAGGEAPRLRTDAEKERDLAAEFAEEDAQLPAHPSLAEDGWLPWLCCQMPGVCLFGMMFVVMVACVIDRPTFYVITAVLTVFVMIGTANMSISSAIGACRMRKACLTDWHALLLGLLGNTSLANAGIMHIIVLPNYKEDEDMMRHTLENLGRSPLARTCVRIVLGMEAREAAAREKAQRLIDQTSHLFAGMTATYHPADLPGDVAGKSSNTQWAFRVLAKRFGPELARYDPSRVFLTVGDADTLWHPQFLSALTYQALTMPAQKRVWAIFQPPILLLRNLYSVPGPTRVSSYGTIMFELSGLANQSTSAHLSYSAYSMTLALALHPGVRGWDADVIAEDHHMFCKCYFASIRQTVEDSEATPEDKKMVIEPQVELHPVYLPAISYLAESSEGWVASCVARFQQARRHSQGVAELGYLLLQYARLVQNLGFSRLPFRTHTQILAIMWKMFTVHITNAVQAFCIVVTIGLMLPNWANWVLAGGVGELVSLVSSQGVYAALGSLSFDVVTTAILGIFGPMPPIAWLTTFTIYTVVCDTLEGRYTAAPQTEEKAAPAALAAPDVQGSAQASAAGSGAGCLGWRRKLQLVAGIQSDMVLLAEPTLLSYGLIPVALAAWSLMRHGTKFEYIVAAKPN